MSRIPAALLAQNEATDAVSDASHKIVKSRDLASLPDVVMIPMPIIEARGSSKPKVIPQNPAPAHQPADEEIQQALSAAERNFERRLADEVAATERDAYQRGLADGERAAAAVINEQNARIEQASAGLDRAWETLASHSEPLLVELAFRMAEAILESPLPESVRSLSTAALSEAIEKLGTTGAVCVSVHPADYMMLDESGILLPLLRNHPNLNWQTDASLERGDWEARSDGAVIRRVARELLDDLARRLNNLDEGA
jgi:flagellar biosynthesis/type III secretory pathway protein FliH